jgi:uncharacterized membrane protein YkgB
VLRGPVGCLAGCLAPVAALIIAIAAMKYVLTTPDLSGMEGGLVVAAVIVVAAIALFGHHSHWTT